MKLDANTVGEMLLEAEADRAASESQLNAAVQIALANGQETARLFEQFKAEARARDAEAARLVEQLRADLSHERAEGQSRADTGSAIEAISKSMEGTNRQLKNLSALVAKRSEPAIVATPAAITLPKFVVERGSDGKVKALVPK